MKIMLLTGEPDALDILTLNCVGVQCFDGKISLLNTVEEMTPTKFMKINNTYAEGNATLKTVKTGEVKRLVVTFKLKEKYGMDVST